LLRLLLLAASLCFAQGDPAATGGEVESFRDSILHYYGFTPEAADAIRAGIVRLEIMDWQSTKGGAHWDQKARTLKLESTQQRAAVRAFAQVWWDVARSTTAPSGTALEAELARTPLKKKFGKLKDGELFAELAAWTMGRTQSGARALPKSLWKYFEPMFTGKIYRTPYYDGGIP
jgi:hypothetical protein